MHIVAIFMSVMSFMMSPPVQEAIKAADEVATVVQDVRTIRGTRIEVKRGRGSKQVQRVSRARGGGNRVNRNLAQKDRG